MYVPHGRLEGKNDGYLCNAQRVRGTETVKLKVHYNEDNYKIVQSLLSKTFDLFSRIFEVLNEIEM